MPLLSIHNGGVVREGHGHAYRRLSHLCRRENFKSLQKLGQVLRAEQYTMEGGSNKAYQNFRLIVKLPSLGIFKVTV